MKSKVPEIIQQPAGIYIHVPFCGKRCDYCDFYSLTYQVDLMEKYWQALAKEIEIYGELNQGLLLRSIYFGGGTPALLSISVLHKILNKIKKYYRIPPDCEITLETNPLLIKEEKLAGWKRIGINRLSVGIQSFLDKELLLLGRQHSGRTAYEKVELLKKYYSNYSLDFIFALPGQSLLDWSFNINKIQALKPPHLSVYNLQIEPGTELSKRIEAGDLIACSEKRDAELYQMTVNELQSLGFKQYEISSYARKGYLSQHNRLYWSFKPYFGFGPAAAGFNGEFRYTNKSDLTKYLMNLQHGRLPEREIVKLNSADKMAEYIFLGLRLNEGISKVAFKNIFGCEIKELYGNQIEKLNRQGLLEFVDQFIFLTEKGRLLANEVFVEFLP